MLDAFLAGYAAPAAGRYFNGLELLAIADRASDLAVAKQIGLERDRVVRLRDASLARLAQAEEALDRLGATPPERPPDSSGFAAWADAVFDAAGKVLAADSAEAVARLLGYVLGEAVATLDATATLSRLRELKPDDLWMRVQGESFEQERATAERRLGRLAAHELLPEPVQVEAGLAAHALCEAATTGDYAARAARAEAASRAVEEHATAVEAAL
ncbi:MAG: hypothetical protein ACRD2W_02535 [Acidimicrobiales bacterium]